MKHNEDFFARTREAFPAGEEQLQKLRGSWCKEMLSKELAVVWKFEDRDLGDDGELHHWSDWGGVGTLSWGNRESQRENPIHL